MASLSGSPELIAALAALLAAGTYSQAELIEALRACGSVQSGTPGLLKLLRLLADSGLPSLNGIREHLRTSLLSEAKTVYGFDELAEPVEIELLPPAEAELWRHCEMMPRGWRSVPELVADARQILELRRDRLLLLQTQLPERDLLFGKIEEELAGLEIAIGAGRVFRSDLRPQAPIPSALAGRFYGEESSSAVGIVEILDGKSQGHQPLVNEVALIGQLRNRLALANVPQWQRLQWLLTLLHLNSPSSVRVIPDLLISEGEREVATILLTLRYGQFDRETWGEWQHWLEIRRAEVQLWENECATLRNKYPAEVALEWYATSEEPDASTLSRSEEFAADHLHVASHVENFLSRWHDVLSAESAATLRAVQPLPQQFVTQAVDKTAPAPKPTTALSGSQAASLKAAALSGVLGETEARSKRPVAPPELPPVRREPPPPSVWQEHVQPFVASNWYLVVGTVMVVLGASLLAYFTWDKHWIVRYTVIPVLLAALTNAFAGVGAWLEKQNEKLRGTGVMLRGAAMALLPLNFLAIAILARDPEVSGRLVLAPIMALAYLGFFGWRVRKWSTGVHPLLGRVFLGAILVLNAIISFSPIALALSPFSPALTLSILVHVGFAALALATITLLSKLTPELVSEHIVPWFAGGLLVVTLLQAFAWSHWITHTMPAAEFYALLVLASGALALIVERRFLELRGEQGAYGTESFVGFALILFGVMLSLLSPWLRLVCLACAGLIWLKQALRRAGTLHYWIGLTFLMLAVASVAVLPRFPRTAQSNWLPYLGLVSIAVIGAIRKSARVSGFAQLGQAAAEFQPVTVFLTVAVAALSQWHLRSAPLPVGIVVLVCAAILGWRALREQRLAWMNSAMAMAAVALPYLGCVDVMGRSLYGNTLVFGLGTISILWLVAIRVFQTPLLLQARSTVLWLYGGLALTAMIVRVLLEQGTPGDLVWSRAILDYAGPFLMAGALVFAAYYSRSLVPSAMAIAIVVVLFPELRQQIQRLMPQIQWGSGFGSGVGAVLLACVGIPMNRWKRLENLEGGDLFLGQHPFPLQRRDRWLFLLPVTLGAVYLAMQVDFFLAPMKALKDQLGPKVIAGVALSYVAWTILAIVLSSRINVRAIVVLSWIAAFEALLLHQQSRHSHAQWQYPFLFSGILIQLTWFASNSLRGTLPHIDRAFSAPALRALDGGSLLLGIACVGLLVMGMQIHSASYLLVFITAELLWHGHRNQRVQNGVLLVALGFVFVAAYTNPGRQMLPDRFVFERSLPALLYSAFAVQVALLVLEARKTWRSRLQWLVAPLQVGGVGILIFVAGYYVSQCLVQRSYLPPILYGVVLITGLLLAARALGSTALVLVPAAFAYVWILCARWNSLAYPDRLTDLLRPIHLGLFGMLMFAASQAGVRLYRSAPKVLCASEVPAALFGSRVWLDGAAAVCATVAVVGQTIYAPWRQNGMELTGAYTAAAMFVAWAYLDFAPALVMIAAAALTLPNIQLVDRLGGHRLDAWGMSGVHLLCIGVVVTLFQGTLLRFATRRAAVIVAMRDASIALAGLILVLLGFHYFANPDLTRITTQRFAISGLLSLAAAFYFRRVSRTSGDTNALRFTCEGLYHYGITIAVWCFALMVPALRSPYTALIALGLPVLYFYARAERGLMHSPDDVVVRQYRTSAAVLSFLLLAMYVFRPAMQMVLFPGQPLNWHQYHWNSPVALIVGVIMLRLHGLGATPWLAFYGGVSLMSGCYFAVTAFPELSPFDNSVGAAWSAAALAHFLIAATYQRSPLRAIVQRMAAITDEHWERLRTYWGVVLMIGSQALIASALIDCFAGHASSYQFAPLLVAAATVFAHQALAGAFRVYFGVAGLLVLLALHADFLLPSFLPKDAVLWVLLAAWAAAIILYTRLPERVLQLRLGPGFFSLFMLCAGHVAYHHFDSRAGLIATGLMMLLSALTPVRNLEPLLPEEQFASATWPLFMPWLVFFTQKEQGYDAHQLLWPSLAAGAVVQVLALYYRFRGPALARVIAGITQSQPRVITQSLNLYVHKQHAAQPVLAVLAFLLSTAVTIFNYDSRLTSAELTAICVIFACSAVSLFFEGRVHQSRWLYVLAQFCLVGLFANIRRQLMLGIGGWNYEYDVWAALAISCCTAGLKQRLREFAPGMSQSMTGTLFALPVITISWVLIHHLNTDIALIVMGLYSVIFAFLGRGEKNSAYNLVAIIGFVAFVITLLWGRLGLHTLHAYVLPIGCGVLALAQLFRRDITRQLRMEVEFVTLAAMLGTSAFYAFVDARHPVGFNLFMLVLCLVAMGLGSLLRIRMYVFLGVAALLLDLASLAYKLVMRFDSTYRMSTIGALLLALGGALVAISVHYKAHQDKWEESLNRVRSRLSGWN